LSCQLTSRGKPTLTESKRPIAFFSNEALPAASVACESHGC
jgi:hypothetical protein